MPSASTPIAVPAQASWLSLPGWIVAPFAMLFALAALTRRWLFDKRWLTAAPSPAWTISIGGLEVGGSGKTPVADYVVRQLLAGGRKPGLLTRGYGRTTRRLIVRERGATPVAATLGDEPAMLVAGGLDVPVAAYAERRIGARALMRHGCDVLVLDDGFSHRRLARDLEIVVLRGESPFGNGHFLPWGTLREPPSSLRRAHVVWLHFRSEPDELVPPDLRQWTHALVVTSFARPRPAYDVATGNVVELKGKRIVGAAGIARPDDFRRSLESMGTDLVDFVPFRDHERYDQAALATLSARAVQAGAEGVVVTPKDAVKLAPVWQGLPLWVVGVELVVMSGADGLAAKLHLKKTL